MKKGNNEGSIRRRSNGTWEGRYSDGRDDKGRQIQRFVYGKTRKEVAEKLNAVLHNKQTGSYVTPNRLLLKDWLVQWLQNYASVSIRPSTYISWICPQPHYPDIGRYSDTADYSCRDSEFL